MLSEFVINQYTLKSTGADGGHHYISTEIEYQGQTRKLTVLFANKSDEKKLKFENQIKIKGELGDDGDKYDLIMSNATLEK